MYDNIKIASLSTLILGLVLVIFITNVRAAAAIGCKESNGTATKVTLNLDGLPELFSNDKLPATVGRAQKCLELLGCIEKLPKLRAPQEPCDMKAEFKILARKGEQYVAFAPTINCLEGSNDCATYPYNLSSLTESSFDPNLRTIVLIGGYMSAAFESWQTDMTKIWLELEEVNVIVVSWTGGNRGLYQFAASNTKIISRQITVLLYYLAKVNNLELLDDSFAEKFYLIGHSLGAHIAGFVGQDLGGKVGRITGLDTAGPNFMGNNGSYRLDSSDAQLVDAIHTNGGNLSFGQAYFGVEMPVGHLDYYANDGKHQPNCNYNLFGCSHKAALDMYIAFLKHELYMREHFHTLKQVYHDYHRIFAYRSPDYEHFNNGSSLSKFCPITTLGDNDLYSEDIRQCLVPVDFLSWYDKVRAELEQKYHIDFEPGKVKSNKFFFYTSPEVPYLNHHNLIRIRVTKTDNLANHTLETRGCDILLDIKQATGRGIKLEIKRYNLIDEHDHYEVIVPYLSPNTFSKYALAELDANDFYTEQYDKLLASVAKIFPASISISGLVVGSPRPRAQGDGMLDALRSLFGMAKGKTNEGKNPIHQCSLNIESVSVQPMKKLHRHLVAQYSASAADKLNPDVLFLFNANSSLPKIQILPPDDKKWPPTGAEEVTASDLISEIYIDRLIVGPLDEREETKLEDKEGQEPFYSEPVAEGHNIETSSVSASTWLKLTIATIIMTLFAVSLFLYKYSPFRKATEADDKDSLIV